MCIRDRPGCDLDDEVWKIFSRNPVKPPQYIGETGFLKNSYATEGCEVYGKVEHSIPVSYTHLDVYKRQTIRLTGSGSQKSI